MLRFGLKLLLAGGSVYYLSEYGVWKNSTETTKLYNKINENLKPYVKEVSSHVPFEVPDLPKSEKVSYIAKQCWNDGVLTTFKFLGNLPVLVSTWTQQGIETAVNSSSVKNIVESIKKSSTSEVKQKENV